MTSNSFKNGGKINGIYVRDDYLDDEKRQSINENWNKTFNSPNSNGILILEKGDDFKTLTLSAKDAMMLESREFNVLEICRYFGCSPILLFDYSKNMYSGGLEEIQLEFLTNCISPILRKIEKELNYKLFVDNQRYTTHIKFDTSSFIQVDKKTNSEYYSKLLNCGALNINEIRNELGYKDVENGDTNYIQVNLMKLGESGLDKKQVDNKLLSEIK
jgi:HK97 family phage portal protein